jgi:iron complex outermembrane receptor protein
MKLTLIVPFFLCTCISQLSAQEKSTELSNVTVTANLLEQQQKETGRNIIFLKGEYFNSLPVNSIDELLRYLPGVEVQQRGPQGSQSNIILRGGTFQQVLIIIDGIKLNDPLTGHFNSYIPVNAAEIERIEILKGAASAVYGPEAVGGVINIITKTFHRKNIVNKNALQGRVAIGEYNLASGEAYARYAKNNTILSAGIQTNNADGPALRGTNGFFNLTNANIAISHLFKNNLSLSFRSAADFRKFNAQNFYTTFASDTANEKVNSWWNHLNIRKQLKKGQIYFDAGYKKLQDQFWFRPTSVPNDNKTNLFTSQLYYTSSINQKFGFTTGLQVHRKQITSNDRGNHTLWHSAAYAILRHRLGKAFYLNESMRLDWDESYGVILVPQVNIAWSPSKLTLRASGGRSFRDADFTERYNNYNKALVPSGSIGNPDLQAENSWSMEAGADYNAAKGLQLSTTFFYRNHQNLIDWAPTPYANMPRKVNLSPTGSYSLAKNAAKVNTTGVEFDVMYNRKLTEHSSLFTSLGYTWIESKNDDPVPSFYISSHARHLFNFSAVYIIRSFAVSVNGLYKKRNERKAAAINAEITPSYFIMGTKLAYTLPRKYGRLFIQADNLFNKTYSDLLGSRMPGRWLSAGFEIAL